jgi:hypothetical protein
MPSDLEAGSSLPDDAVPVKIPQGNGDPLTDAIEFYGDVNQNSVAEVQVGVMLWVMFLMWVPTGLLVE